MTPRGARWLLLLAVAAGAAGGLALSVGRRHGPRPYGDRLCEQIWRDHLDAYAAAGDCRADADCVVDPRPAAPMGACERARAAAAPRQRIAALEARFAEVGCRMPEVRCPEVTGARCRAGRCAAVTSPRRP